VGQLANMVTVVNMSWKIYTRLVVHQVSLLSFHNLCVMLTHNLAVLKYLLAEGLIHGDCMTVTGRTLAENLRDLPGLPEKQDIIRSLSNPIKSSGHIQILRGNLAPEGAVAKITGKEGLRFEGVARVFDCEEDMLAALERGEIGKGHVVVIRYEGPKGGPGMPEMCK
jgi:dihydroxy-acid dehydratase